MAINVVNETGDTDYYVGFSNTLSTDLTTVIGYFTALTVDKNGEVYKMATNDKYYSSGSFAYITLVKKSPTGGALIFKVDDLVSAYGDGLMIRVTNNITDAGVYDAYYKDGSKYTGGIVPMGTKGGPILYVKLPSYNIKSNVIGSSDPTDYSVSDMVTSPAFAYMSPTSGLATVSAPIVKKAKPGGWPIWVWFLVIVLLIILVVVVAAGVMIGYKKYKNR